MLVIVGSRTEVQCTFLKKPGWDGIRIRLFVRKVEKNLKRFQFQ